MIFMMVQNQQQREAYADLNKTYADFIKAIQRQARGRGIPPIVLRRVRYPSIDDIQQTGYNVLDSMVLSDPGGAEQELANVMFEILRTAFVGPTLRFDDKTTAMSNWRTVLEAVKQDALFFINDIYRCYVIDVRTDGRFPPPPEVEGWPLADHQWTLPLNTFQHTFQNRLPSEFTINQATGERIYTLPNRIPYEPSPLVGVHTENSPPYTDPAFPLPVPNRNPYVPGPPPLSAQQVPYDPAFFNPGDRYMYRGPGYPTGRYSVPAVTIDPNPYAESSATPQYEHYLPTNFVHHGAIPAPSWPEPTANQQFMWDQYGGEYAPTLTYPQGAWWDSLENATFALHGG